jgi:hypothetical protein
MSKYAGNKWDDDFKDTDEAVSVTRYRVAEELYGHIINLRLSADAQDKLYQVGSELAINWIETMLNGNGKAHRAYVQRMEAAQVDPTVSETAVQSAADKYDN